MNKPTFISLWAGDLDCSKSLPSHLKVLYDSIGASNFLHDPEVCAEREPIPIEELLEPFSLCEEFIARAMKTAGQEFLHLASVVVAVYTYEPPDAQVKNLKGCRLHFLGTFPDELDTPTTARGMPKI